VLHPDKIVVMDFLRDWDSSLSEMGGFADVQIGYKENFLFLPEDGFIRV
jgi:hypothetical protein